MEHTKFRTICDTLLIKQTEVANEFATRAFYMSEAGIQGRIKEECEDVARAFIQRMYGSDADILLPMLVKRLKGHETNLFDTYSAGHDIWFGIYDVRIAIAVTAADAFQLDENGKDVKISPPILAKIRQKIPNTIPTYDNSAANTWYHSDHLALTIAREYGFEVPPLS